MESKATRSELPTPSSQSSVTGAIVSKIATIGGLRGGISQDRLRAAEWSSYIPDRPRSMLGLGSRCSHGRHRMAKKLKTYQTSLGFFDLAMAAPSMKAALEAWGADSNLFHQGAAKESHDPDVIAATMAKPGVVLRRPVGTDRPFSEHAELPTDLGGGGPTKAARKLKGPRAKKPSSRPVDKVAERKAAFDYNGNGGAASLNGRRKKPPGKRTVNAGSRPSTRRRLRWTRPIRSTRSGPPPSRPRSRLLRRDRKPRSPLG